MIKWGKSLFGFLRTPRSAKIQQTSIRSIVQGRKGLVLGAYESCNHELKLSPVAAELDNCLGGKLSERFKDVRVKCGKVDVTHDLGGFYVIALVGIGPEGFTLNEGERLNECRESVRWAAAHGVKALEEQECSSMCIDPMVCGDAAAEGAKLAAWKFGKFKTQKDDPNIGVFSNHPKDREGFDYGAMMADCQNTARYLSEAPANHMTPKIFCEEAIRILCPCGVNVTARHLRWIEDHKMFAFLNMAKGSCEPPFFLEIHYCGGQEGDRPVVMAGKGVTYDSGGLCLKRCLPNSPYEGDMAERKAAMNGAASIVGTIKALAQLNVGINVVGLIPLFENMVGGGAIKPGDVVMSLNGKTIVVNDTDKEGRLALADTLAFSSNFKPCLDMTIGNLAYGSRQSLGSGATPVFSSSQTVWNEMDKAGAFTGDRVWRFPLWKAYKKRVKTCIHVDVCNTGQGSPNATPCLGAAFLSEFVPGCDFAHLDTTGTGLSTRGFLPYLRRGSMTGRPTRTLIQFMKNMASPVSDVTAQENPCTAT